MFRNMSGGFMKITKVTGFIIVLTILLRESAVFHNRTDRLYISLSNTGYRPVCMLTES